MKIKIISFSLFPFLLLFVWFQNCAKQSFETFSIQNENMVGEFGMVTVPDSYIFRGKGEELNKLEQVLDNLGVQGASISGDDFITMKLTPEQYSEVLLQMGSNVNLVKYKVRQDLKKSNFPKDLRKGLPFEMLVDVKKIKPPDPIVLDRIINETARDVQKSKSYTRSSNASTNTQPLNSQLVDYGSPQVDNSATPHFPPIGFQGAIGSCAAWASGYYYFTYNRSRYLSKSDPNRRKPSDPDGDLETCNPLFPYYHTFYPNTEDDAAVNLAHSGSFPSENIRAISDMGCQSVAYNPDVDQISRPLDEKDYLNALSFGRINSLEENHLDQGMEINSWKVINALRAILKKGELSVGSLVVTSEGLLNYPKESPSVDNDVLFGETGSLLGYHTVTIVGFKDDKDYFDGSPKQGAFLIANSWGAFWGVGNTMSNDIFAGFAWIAYDSLVNGKIKIWAMIPETEFKLKTLPKVVGTYPISLSKPLSVFSKNINTKVYNSWYEKSMIRGVANQPWSGKIHQTKAVIDFTGFLDKNLMDFETNQQINIQSFDLIGFPKEASQYYIKQQPSSEDSYDVSFRLPLANYSFNNIDGVCGTLHGHSDQSLTSPVSRSQFCASGEPTSIVKYATEWRWYCMGGPYNKTTMCSTYGLVNKYGCGPIDGKRVSPLPLNSQDNRLCLDGEVSTFSEEENSIRWFCKGILDSKVEAVCSTAAKNAYPFQIPVDTQAIHPINGNIRIELALNIGSSAKKVNLDVRSGILHPGYLKYFPTGDRFTLAIESVTPKDIQCYLNGNTNSKSFSGVTTNYDKPVATISCIDNSQVCIPGTKQGCLFSTGVEGFRTCNSTGTGYGNCQQTLPPKPTFLLTLNKIGHGEVDYVVNSESKKAEIYSTHPVSIDQDSIVTLSVISGTGYVFSGWKVNSNGDVCPGVAPCKIKMNEAKVITATFITQ